MTYKQLLKLARSRKDYGIYTQVKYTTAKGITKSRLIPSTYKQIRTKIQKELGLTKRQYQKVYDVTRNKLRHYERVTGANKQSALSYLYHKASSIEAHRRSGVRYVQSNKSKFIESFSSRSSGIKTEGITKDERKLLFSHIEKTFGSGRTHSGLVYQNEYAKRIAENIKDPQKRLQALTEYANRRRDLIKEDKHGAIKQNEKRIPFTNDGRSDTSGSYDEEAYNETMEKYGGGEDEE